MALGEGEALEASDEAVGDLLGKAVAVAEFRGVEVAVAFVEDLLREPRADALGNGGAAEEMGEFGEDEVDVDLGLTFEIAEEGFAADFAFAFGEKQGGLDAVGNFLHKGDERGDVALVERFAGVIFFQFGDDGRGKKEREVELIAHQTEKSSPIRGKFFR